MAYPFPNDVRRFVESTAWTFAKTYAKTWPHEYIVLDGGNADMVRAIARHIAEHGVAERFYHQVRRYHHEGGKVYWFMDDTPEDADLINRCDESQTYESRLASGSLPPGELAPGIDVNFDFRSDTPEGCDPDSHSPTLRRYHQLLWSKPLPCGTRFVLNDDTPGEYLHHRSVLGEFFLSSDTVIPSFESKYPRTEDELRLAKIIRGVSEAELSAFKTVTYTIGGMMIFPSNRINRQLTINGARGFCSKIRDRFDLTVECIRRHYYGEPSPLSDVLQRYADFFGLFQSFRGYVDFFLLHDIVTSDYSTVRFFTQFESFDSSPLPRSVEEYRRYRDHATDFVTSRNRRIHGSFM